jgi:anti-anti-sigma factor
MELQVYKVNTDLYFRISGRIVLDECDRLKANTVPLIDKSTGQVHLDLSDVEFIDSAGLGVLVGLKMTANKSKARLVLISPSKGVNDILYVSKLESIFDIVTGNEAEGIRAGVAMPSNLIKSIRSEESPAPAEARQSSESGRKTGSGRRSKASFAIRSGQSPAGGEVQEPAAAGSVPKTGAGEEPDEAGSLQDRVDQHCREAVDFMRQGDYDRAAEAYLHAIELDPDYLPALNNLAIVYEKKPAWHDKAVEQWEQVLKLSERMGDQKHIDRASKHLANLRRQ